MGFYRRVVVKRNICPEPVGVALPHDFGCWRMGCEARAESGLITCLNGDVFGVLGHSRCACHSDGRAIGHHVPACSAFDRTELCAVIGRGDIDCQLIPCFSGDILKGAFIGAFDLPLASASQVCLRCLRVQGHGPFMVTSEVDCGGRWRSGERRRCSEQLKAPQASVFGFRVCHLEDHGSVCGDREWERWLWRQAGIRGIRELVAVDKRTVTENIQGFIPAEHILESRCWIEGCGVSCSIFPVRKGEFFACLGLVVFYSDYLQVTVEKVSGAKEDVLIVYSLSNGVCSS